MRHAAPAAFASLLMRPMAAVHVCFGYKSGHWCASHMMSALPPKAHINRDGRDVRFVPKADIAALIVGQQKCNVEEQGLARLSSRGDHGPTLAAMLENFALAAEHLSDR